MSCATSAGGIEEKHQRTDREWLLLRRATGLATSLSGYTFQRADSLLDGGITF